MYGEDYFKVLVFLRSFGYKILSSTLWFSGRDLVSQY